MYHKQQDGSLEEEAFHEFLEKIIGFVWAYALTNPGVNALRTPVYREMVNIIQGRTVNFSDFKFDRANLVSIIHNFQFHNQRQITRSMITWWAFERDEQQLLPLDTRLEIEHIYARNRAKNEPLSDASIIELLGNKSLLEQRINIRAADYRFADKVKYYKGFDTARGEKPGTAIFDLRELGTKMTNFSEADIVKRNDKIIEGFCAYLERNNLLK